MRLSERFINAIDGDGVVSEKNAHAIEDAVNFIRKYEDAEERGRLVLLPCKVGDTVWFYLYEDRYYLREGIYRGTITELKSVQRLNQSPLVLAIVEYEYPDPLYDGEIKISEMDCSFGAYGTWARFYLTREEAEAAMMKEVCSPSSRRVRRASDE